VHGGPSAEGYLSAAAPESDFEEAPMSTTSPAQLSYDVLVSDGPAGPATSACRTEPRNRAPGLLSADDDMRRG